MVCIAAFQAVDLGSIPGRRNILFFLSIQENIKHGSSDHSSAFSYVDLIPLSFMLRNGSKYAEISQLNILVTSL